MNNCFFLFVCNGYQFIYDSLDRFFNFNINIFNNFNFNYFLLYYWNMNMALNFFDDNFLSFYFNQFFHNFRNFNNFLYDSGDCDYFLDDSLYFHQFGYFDNFFNDFFDLDSNFFDSFDISGNLNNYFFNRLYNFRYLSVVIDDFDNLNDFRLMDDNWIPQVDLLDYGVLYSFDNRFFDDLSHYFGILMDNRDFDDFLNFDRDFFNNLNDFLNDDFDGFDDFLPDKFLSDDLNLSKLNFLMDNLNNFLDDSWNFNNFLYGLDNWHNFLNDTVDRFMNGFNMIMHFKGFSIFDCGNYLFNHTFDHFNLNLFDYLFDNSVFVDWDLNNFLNDPLNGNNFFFDDFDFLRLLLNMIYNSLNLNNFFNFNNFFNNGWDLNYFWHFLGQVNDLFYDGRYFNYLMNDLLQRNYLLNDLSLNSKHLNRYIHDFFNLLDFLYFNNFLNFLSDRYHNRHLDSFFNNFFNDFLNLLYLLHRPEHSQDILHIYQICNLSLDHGDDSLIDFQRETSLKLDFL
jgi:hypothetical protein